jgi:hypothetical protein
MNVIEDKRDDTRAAVITTGSEYKNIPVVPVIIKNGR